MTDTRVPTVDLDRLRGMWPIGEEPTGTLFAVPSVRINKAWPAVYREYRPPHRDALDPEALRRAVALLGEIGDQAGRWLCERAAWPTAVVTLGGEVTGYLTRQAPDAFTFRPTVARALLAEWPPPEGTEAARLAILHDLATVLAALAEWDVTPGTLDPGTIMVTAAGDARCFLTRCDTLPLDGRPPYPPEQGTALTFSALVVGVLARDPGATPDAIAARHPDLAALTSAAAPSDWSTWTDTLAAAAARVAGGRRARPSTVAPGAPSPLPASPPAPATAPPHAAAWSAASEAPTTAGWAPGPDAPPDGPGEAATFPLWPAEPVTGPPAGAWAPPDPAPRRRRTALVAATAAVVIAVAGAVAVLARTTTGDAEPAGAPPPATRPTMAGTGGVDATGLTGSPEPTGHTGSPEGEPTAATAAPAPTAVGLVDTTAVAADPLAPAIAGMFDRYFAAINARDYDLAIAHYDPAGVIDPRDPAERRAFAAGVSTTTDSEIRLLSIGPGGGSGGVALARIAFRSEQAAGYGPKGRERETCTRWDVTYALTSPAEGRYLILRATAAASQPCR